VDTPGLKDLEYQAEFWRQQFEVYEARRLAEETHANAVVAAALAVAAAALASYGRKPHPSGWWLAGALLGVGFAFVFALSARVVSWETPLWLGGPYWRKRIALYWRERIAREEQPKKRLPFEEVGMTLDRVRSYYGSDQRELRQRAIDHWQAREQSTYCLGNVKEARLRLALLGFVGPALYFGVGLPTTW
jgi:hypothetical protein